MQSISQIIPLTVWEGGYQSFEAAAAEAAGDGFSGSMWLARSIHALKECLSAVDHFTPIPPFYMQRSILLPITASMMLNRSSKLRILDFGGGLGIGYLSLVESIPKHSERVAYTIVEVPRVCAEGRNLIGNRGVTFLESLPESAECDLIHSASAIQYIKDWKGLLKGFAALDPEYMLLSDVFAGKIAPFVTLQNYYESRIPHWFLNIDELLCEFDRLGYQLVMKSYATSRRLDSVDTLPMDNFPEERRLQQSLHLLLRRSCRS